MSRKKERDVELKAILKQLDVEDYKDTEENRVKLYELWAMKNVHKMTPIPFDEFQIWKHPLLLNYRTQEKEIIRALTENTNLIELKDRKCACGNSRFYISIRQTRGLDEGQTTYYQCSNCSKTFAQN